MKHIKIYSFTLIILIALLAACTTTQPTITETITTNEEGVALVIGDISDEPAETIKGT